MASTAKRTLALALALALCANGAPFSALAEDAPGEAGAQAAQSAGESPEDTGQNSAGAQTDGGEEATPPGAEDTGGAPATEDGAGDAGGETSQDAQPGPPAEPGVAEPDTDPPVTPENTEANPEEPSKPDTDPAAPAGPTGKGTQTKEGQTEEGQAKTDKTAASAEAKAGETQQETEPDKTPDAGGQEKADGEEAPAESGAADTAVPPCPYVAEATYPDGSLLQVTLPGGLPEGAELKLETQAKQAEALQQAWGALGRDGTVAAGYTFTVGYLAGEGAAMPADARLDFTAAACAADGELQLLQLGENPALVGQAVACTAGEKAGLSLQSPRPGQYGVALAAPVQAMQSVQLIDLMTQAADPAQTMALLGKGTPKVTVNHIDVEVNNGKRTVKTIYTDKDGKQVGEPVTTTEDLVVDNVTKVVVLLTDNTTIERTGYQHITTSQDEFRANTFKRIDMNSIQSVTINFEAHIKGNSDTLNLVYTADHNAIVAPGGPSDSCHAEPGSTEHGLDFTIEDQETMTQKLTANLSVKKVTNLTDLAQADKGSCTIGVYTRGEDGYQKRQVITVVADGSEVGLELAVGTYYLKEETAAEISGYSLTDTTWQQAGGTAQREEYFAVALAQTGLTAVVCTNSYTELPPPKPQPGKLTVEKLVNLDGEPAGEEALTKQAFTFAVGPVPAAGSEEGKMPEPLATFTLKAGQTSTPVELLPGDYCLWETDTAVPGYLLTGTEWRKNTDPEAPKAQRTENPESPEKQAAGQPGQVEGCLVTITENGAVNVVCTNSYTPEKPEPKRGKLILKENSNLDGEYFFDIYDEADTEHTSPRRLSATPGEEGQILELEPGEYGIYEEDPSREGYTVNTTWQVDGNSASTDAQNYLHVTVNAEADTAVICTNLFTQIAADAETGVLAVAKTSNLDGVYLFGVYRKEGVEYRNVGAVSVESGRVSDTLRLEVGDYYLAEIRADHPGYDLTATWRINGTAATVNVDGYLPFTVDTNMAVVVECHNEYTQSAGTLELKKTANLSGIYHFTVYRKEGTRYYAVDSLSVPNDRESATLRLMGGDYYLAELDAERDGFALATSWRIEGETATVNEDGYLPFTVEPDKSVQVGCHNEYTYRTGTLKLTKVSNLAGDYAFYIFAQEEDTVPYKTVTLHSGGSAAINLPEGCWYLAETNAARSGYSLATIWCINSKAEELTANGRLAVQVPKTGSVAVVCGNNYTANAQNTGTSSSTSSSTSSAVCTPAAAPVIVYRGIPQTGDGFALAAWVALAACGAGGLLWLRQRRKKKRLL